MRPVDTVSFDLAKKRSKISRRKKEVVWKASDAVGEGFPNRDRKFYAAIPARKRVGPIAISNSLVLGLVEQEARKLKAVTTVVTKNMILEQFADAALELTWKRAKWHIGLEHGLLDCEGRPISGWANRVIVEARRAYSNARRLHLQAKKMQQMWVSHGRGNKLTAEEVPLQQPTKKRSSAELAKGPVAKF